MLTKIFVVLKKLKDSVVEFLNWDEKGNLGQNELKKGAIIEHFRYAGDRLEGRDCAVFRDYVWASNDEKSTLRCSATPLQDIKPNNLT